MHAVLGGWSVAAKLSAHTGTPFSVYNTRLSGLSSFGGVALADVVDPKIRTPCGHSAVETPCFTPSQFAAASAQADLGNWPRNSFRGPGYFGVDSSLYKTIAIGERMRFTLGASAYNLLNHPSLAHPNQNAGGGGLGLITFTLSNPSGPYGLYGGPSGRALVVTGRFSF